ncbi:hypothetical protein CDD81_2912 [Ophiocordyceps australis]|uniref:Uncharacterized protein n=1 Tax=Ophiocordyceps australis TaxID=1399860 RepID=A0A2C5YHP3_9HYPO|nr:hypothetical protein CDD81_2912 [Ophiocordyceps australis]
MTRTTCCAFPPKGDSARTCWTGQLQVSSMEQMQQHCGKQPLEQVRRASGPISCLALRRDWRVPQSPVQQQHATAQREATLPGLPEIARPVAMVAHGQMRDKSLAGPI